MRDPAGLAVVGALLMAWLGFRAGDRYRQAKQTWADYRFTKEKLKLFAKLRWVHLGAAVFSLACLYVVLAVILRTATP